MVKKRCYSITTHQRIQAISLSKNWPNTIWIAFASNLFTRFGAFELPHLFPKFKTFLAEKKFDEEIIQEVNEYFEDLEETAKESWIWRNIGVSAFNFEGIKNKLEK